MASEAKHSSTTKCQFRMNGPGIEPHQSQTHTIAAQQPRNVLFVTNSSLEVRLQFLQTFLLCLLTAYGLISGSLRPPPDTHHWPRMPLRKHCLRCPFIINDACAIIRVPRSVTPASCRSVRSAVWPGQFLYGHWFELNLLRVLRKRTITCCLDVSNSVWC